MVIDRREVEQAVADTIFDNISDQEKAAKNLKTYTFSFNPIEDFEIQLEAHIEKMRRIGRALFIDCEQMSDEQAISVALKKPWNLKTVDASYSSNFNSKQRGNAMRLYKVNNQNKSSLLTIKEFEKVFPAVKCHKVGKKIKVVDKNAVFNMQFDSEYD
jgi:hypothetical protein